MATFIPVSAPEAQILLTTYASTAELATASFRTAPSASRTTLFLFASTNGTLDIDTRLSDGTWREIQANIAITANDLTAVIFDFRVPILRGRFTPASSPGSVTVDAAYAGHGG